MGFFEWMFAFGIGSAIANLLVKHFFGDIVNKKLLRSGYAEGYWDASVNLKMYYHVMSKTVPPSDWLRHTMGNRLDTRDKFMTLMNTDEKARWTLK